MENNKIFADGMRFERPGEKVPEWIKGKISINAPKFIEFLQKYQNEKGWLNLDLKESKQGTLYVELNTYKPGQTQTKSQPNNGEITEGDDNLVPY